MSKEYIVETEEFQKRLYKVQADGENEALIKVYERRHDKMIGTSMREIRFAKVADQADPQFKQAK